MMEKIILKDMPKLNFGKPEEVKGKKGFQIIVGKPVNRKEWIYVEHTYSKWKSKDEYYVMEGLSENKVQLWVDNSEMNALDIAYDLVLDIIEHTCKSPLWEGTPEIIDKTSRGRKSKLEVKSK